jgi:hypothetical protein
MAQRAFEEFGQGSNDIYLHSWVVAYLPARQGLLDYWSIGVLPACRQGRDYWKLTLFHHSIIPLFHHSTIPPFHHSTIPSNILTAYVKSPIVALY